LSVPVTRFERDTLAIVLSEPSVGGILIGKHFQMVGMIDPVIGINVDPNCVRLHRAARSVGLHFIWGFSVPVPRRACRLWSDPVFAALTGVGSALTVAITPAFWVATAWPTGATAVIIVATARSLLASQPVIATSALVRSDATHVPDDRALGIEVGIKYWSEWQDSNLRLQRPERK
jgi:hypothetical protein